MNTNKIFDALDNFNIDDVKTNGFVLRSGNKILKFSLEKEESYENIENEIADSMAISRSYVSRIETKAINKLAKEFRE